jgi:PAS domain S-box-containing protein
MQENNKNSKLEENFTVLSNLIADPVCVVDEKGIFLAVNQAMSQVLGFGEQEIVGKNLMDVDFLDQENKAILLKNLAKRMKGLGVASYEVEATAKNGEIKFIEIKGKKIWYANKNVDLVVLHDVTEQKKKTEERIRLSEEKYKNLFENAPDVIVTVDLTGKITSVNKAIMQYGFRENEIVGSFIFKLVPTEYNQRLLTGLKNTAAGNPSQGEIEILTPNGKRSAEYNSNTIWVNGKVVGYQTIMRDVTERKKAEKALRESEEKHRKLFEESMDAIFVADAATGIIVDCNPAASKLVGWQKSELVGQHQSIVFPQEQIDGGFSRSFKKHLKDPTKTLETQVMQKTGEIKDVAVKSTIFELKGKQLIQGTFRDISEKKQAERKLKKVELVLRQERNMLEAVTENVGAGLTIIGKDYSILWTNKVMKHMRGIPDLEGRTCYATYNRLDTVCPECGVKKVFEGKEIDSREFSLFDREKGSTIWTQLIATPIKDKDGNVTSALELVVPITERKMMEQSLKGSEERFRTIMNSALDAIIAIDDKLNIVAWNPAASRIYGYTQEEIIGKPIFTLIPFNITQTAKQEIRRFVEARPKDSIGNIIETVGVKKDGTEFPAELSFSKMQINGKNHGVSFIKDITERKQAQKKQQDYSKELEETVAQRTAQLRAMQDRLLKAERLAAIGELAGMVGHDLRNPLTGIKNAAYYLRKKGKTISEAQAKEMLEIIDKAIVHSNKIINDLLDYSREMHLELTESALRTLLDEAVRMIQVPDQIQILNHTLEDIKFNVDADKMMRVFINLIKNAVDAMPEKGTLEITSHKTKDNLEIAFADTGTGIPDETLSKIFSPLFTTKAQGMGFGLAICKRIVESHGGTITVKTAVNKGTTFTITLPIKLKFEVRGEKTSINMPESLLSTTKA